MSTSDAVFHRRNKQVQDAIDGQNLKQALQLIDKRIKKGEDTRFLKAWKANILYRHADDANRNRGISETLELCKAEPPTTDLDTLDILHETLERMPNHADTLRSIWEKASKANSKDLDIQMRWFEYAFEGDDWKSAQKAAMALQSNFPKTRKYHLWAIFLSYLVSIDQASSEADRKLFGMLAYRMISKAAESVPSDSKELLSPPRAIQSAEELLLLIKIFESQERHAEIVKILDSENLGISSRVIQNDWSFIGEKLSSLEKAQMWTDGLAYTKGLLAIPTNEAEQKALQERDDWAVWHLLIAATKNINTSETTDATRKFVDEFVAAVPKSRNAQLARLDLMHWTFQAGNLKADDLVTACQEYFDRNKHKLYCFGDLRSYVPALDKTSVLKFVEYISASAAGQTDEKNPSKEVAKINALKCEYCFLLSADESNASKTKVEEFVSRCLQVYREVERPEKSSAPSTIESQPSDDLCLLAAMSLIRFSGAWISDSSEQVPDTVLIRAAAILERLLVDSPHNYQALLLLVRIYLRLGAGSLALKTFSKLSVKQIQFETVAHNLFTRLATIHPHSAPPIEGAEYKDFNPQSAFVQALNFYKSADVTTVRNRSKGLDYGSYFNVQGTIDLQKRLKQSICRRMWALDVRRIQRLAGGDPMGRYQDMARDTSPLVDQRIFDAFMNCEAPGQPTFEERMRLGPLPRDQWIKSSRMTDHLFDLLKSMTAQKPVSVEPELPRVEDVVGPEAESEMTPSEIESARVNLNILTLALFLNGSKSVTSEQVDNCLTQVEEWLESKLNDVTVNDANVSPVISNTAIYVKSEAPTAPSWRYFHSLFTVLDSLKALSLLYTVGLRKGTKGKLPKERVEKLADRTRQVHQGVRANVRALKSFISAPGVLGSLTDLVVAGSGSEDGSQLRTELDKTLDTAALEVFCVIGIVADVALSLCLMNNAMAEFYLHGSSPSPSYDYRYSHQPWNVVTQTVCLVVSTGFVAMRLYSKIYITKAPGWEDWTCCLAWFGLLGFVGISFEADRHGNGVHQWEVDPHDLHDFAKLINASQVLYGPLIFLTKLSIFLLYLRVFAPSPKCNQWWFIQILMGLNFFFYLADTIVKIFECTPRARIWDKTVPGRCIDADIPVLVTSIVNVVSDIMMLLMPIRVSYKTTPLNTPKTRISRTKGQSSRRTAFVREIAREVVGLAPYERRIIELLRNTQDKRARKLAKKRPQALS
ncbi:hypothetical protein CBS147346_3844 [Aspergillus niger]|nr:hypothetical protein CBS147346_3844 [Aspergillus niger]